MRAAPRQPRNWVALVLSVITGLGHFYLDHYVAGAVLFGLFATTLNGVFLGFTLQATSSPEVLRAVSIFAFVLVWAFGMWHAYRLSYGTDRVAMAQAKDALLREGLIDYLRDDLEDAARKIERAAALDVDWIDPDPLFHLGVVSARLAERRGARGDARGSKAARRKALSAFKDCLTRDPMRKWRAEVDAELRRMRGPGSFTGRMRKVGGALKDVINTASGMFARPALGAPPAASGGPLLDANTVADAAHIRAAITQTRKKKRFSAKFPPLTKADLEGPTHADLRLAPAPSPSPAAPSPTPPAPPVEEPLPETKPDLSLDLGRPERSGVRRFPRDEVSDLAPVNGGAAPVNGDVAPLNGAAPPEEPAVRLEAAVVEEPEDASPGEPGRLPSS